MMRYIALLLFLAVGLAGCGQAADQTPSPPKVSSPAARQCPLHTQVTATVFWVGESAGPDNANIANAQSSWDDRWQKHFGGVDDPHRRQGSRPAGFVPKENPFYFALPYNDFAGSRRKPDAAAVVPWAGDRAWGPGESMCKNHWVRITRGSKSCYAQWEDVGPFRTDDAAYVFGSAAPRNRRNLQAGLDVSPAVRDYLALGGMDKVNWQFVEASSVPDGPWKEIVTTSQVCWR
jgi:hypothetical protein